MTNNATSRAMASALTGELIFPPFSGDTTPGHPEVEEAADQLLATAAILGSAWDETRS
jgi:hypothetical protein